MAARGNRSGGWALVGVAFFATGAAALGLAQPAWAQEAPPPPPAAETTSTATPDTPPPPAETTSTDTHPSETPAAPPPDTPATTTEPTTTTEPPAGQPADPPTTDAPADGTATPTTNGTDAAPTTGTDADPKNAVKLEPATTAPATTTPAPAAAAPAAPPPAAPPPAAAPPATSIVLVAEAPAAPAAAPATPTVASAAAEAEEAPVIVSFRERAAIELQHDEAPATVAAREPAPRRPAKAVKSRLVKQTCVRPHGLVPLSLDCRQVIRAAAVTRAPLAYTSTYASPEVRAAIDRGAAVAAATPVHARPPPDSKAAKKRPIPKIRPILPFGGVALGAAQDGFSSAGGSASSSRMFALAAVPLRVPRPFTLARLRLPSTITHGVLAAPPPARPG